MSSTILTNWTVYYADDAGASGGYKQIRWTGSTGTNTVNELYSALMNLFDNPSQNDAHDSIPMKAVTPTLYQIGLFDAGDEEPWFIDPVSVQHLTGGGLDSTSWTRVQDSNAGIVKVPYTTGTQFVASDVGLTITHADGDTGTLLYFDSTNNVAYIRPTNSTSTHNWDTGSGTFGVTGAGGTGSVTQSSAPISGESIWTNIYTIGTIEDDTEIYIKQNGSTLTQWWDTGHIDILVLVQDYGTVTDEGDLTIYARQYTKTYDHFETTVANGGRNPIPLSTLADLNNTEGYRTITLSSATGTWDVGNYIYYDNAGTLTWSTTTKKGVITSGGSGATPTLEYYLIGDLTDFGSTDDVTEYDPSTGSDGDANGQVNGVAPSNVSPATLSITLDFSYTTADLNNGNGAQPYAVTINGGGNLVADVYEHLKYITRRGYTSDIDTENVGQTIIGEHYRAVGDIRLLYDTPPAGAFTEGLTVTGGTSGATGIITSNDSTNGALILRDVQGTFVDAETITDTSTGSATVDLSAALQVISPVKQSPFGTFAGGKFFGARGVYITNINAADDNNYELVDALGVRQVPPATVPIVVNDVVSGDRVSVFRLNVSGEIEKDYLTSHATNNTTGLSTFDVQETIPTDTPASGVLRVVDTSTQTEQRYSYTAWSGSQFTGVSPTLDRTYDGTDTAYVPYLDEQATGTSVSTSVTYTTDRDVLARVRVTGIIPFTTTGQLTSSGYSVNAIRTSDDIFTP